MKAIDGIKLHTDHLIYSLHVASSAILTLNIIELIETFHHTVLVYH